MIHFLSVAIGVGLVVSLAFSEMFGLAAGGMVVPGYFALYLNQPLSVAFTMAAAIVTYLIVHSLSTVVIVYGKRRTVLMILVGYLVRLGFDALPLGLVVTAAAPYGTDMVVIGFIIPGLIAIWIDRQGMVETLSTLLTAAVVVRLILILVFGTEMPQ